MKNNQAISQTKSKFSSHYPDREKKSDTESRKKGSRFLNFLVYWYPPLTSVAKR